MSTAWFMAAFAILGLFSFFNDATGALHSCSF